MANHPLRTSRHRRRRRILRYELSSRQFHTVSRRGRTMAEEQEPTLRNSRREMAANLLRLRRDISRVRPSRILLSAFLTNVVIFRKAKGRDDLRAGPSGRTRIVSTPQLEEKGARKRMPGAADFESEHAQLASCALLQSATANSSEDRCFSFG